MDGSGSSTVGKKKATSDASSSAKTPARAAMSPARPVWSSQVELAQWWHGLGEGADAGGARSGLKHMKEALVMEPWRSLIEREKEDEAS